MDKIPERLRTAAEGVAKATQMMADAKSQRNRSAGDVGANYRGLKKEQTAEWQAAEIIERQQAALETLLDWNKGIQAGRGNHHPLDHIDLIEKALLGSD